MKTTNWVLLLGLLAAGPASAEMRKIDERHPALPDGEVSIELLAGEVRVEGWDKNEVHVIGEYDDTQAEVEIEVEEGEVSIEADVPEGEHHDAEGVRLTLKVPLRTRLSIEVISGDLEVSGLAGEVSIEAISGTIEVSGELVELEVECVSGQMDVRTSRALRRAELSTVSGDIDVRGPIVEGRVSASAVNGDISVSLSPDSSAQFEVTTFSGKIQNGLTEGQPRRTHEHLPAQELSLTVGAGKARVSVESFNGTIQLRRER